MSKNIRISPITGKKILFFAPAFFGYEDKIADKMRQLGARVDAFDVRSVTSAAEKALLKVNPHFFDGKTEKYYGKIYAKVRKTDYDYVLFIKCDMPTKRVLATYKRQFKNAKFCLHMWDSIRNIPYVENKFQYFDFISSFDRNDCKKYEDIHFRPLYYCDEYKREVKSKDEYDFDLCFIGTIHSDRWRILKELKKQAKEQGLRVYYFPYLQSRFIYMFYKLTKPEFGNADIKEFRFDKISSEKTAEMVEKSRVIIDIQHPKQTGLTIRTIEMIGMNKKLITTNADIRKYDFYNPKNIQVIDRKHPLLSGEFRLPYEPLNTGIYDRYSLESWIYEILGISVEKE